MMLYERKQSTNEDAVLDIGDTGNPYSVLAKCLGGGVEDCGGCLVPSLVTGEVGRSIKSPLMTLTYQRVPS